MAHDSFDAGPRVIHLLPDKYVYVLDTNSNVSRVLAGPLTYTRQEHEQVLTTEPQQMIVLPAQHYVEIRNPVVRGADQEILRDQYHQAKLRHGEIKFRVFDQYPDLFPLYPGEEQVGAIKQLRVVPVDCALRTRATPATNSSILGQRRTYYPRVQEEVITDVNTIIIQKNEAVKFRAEKKCKDSLGMERAAGEEWLVRTPGAYLPQIDEVLVDVVCARIVTDRTALHLRAVRTFNDVYGIQRKAGEEWLVTADIAETHVPDVHEDVMGTVEIVTLTNRQYCVVVDPVVKGVPKRGTRELRKGEASFFLQPGEQLEHFKIQDVLILGEDEAVLVQANESFVEKEDGKDTKREPGERWMVHGPREYIPLIQLQVLEVRKAVPLDSNEGVYVRDKKTGHVRAVKGETYMLQPTEELWAKYLLPEVEELLVSQGTGSAYVQDPTSTSGVVTSSLGQRSSAPLARDPTRLVTFEVPHNAAVQVYDYKTTSSRILFGPTLVMLDPDEQKIHRAASVWQRAQAAQRDQERRCACRLVLTLCVTRSSSRPPTTRACASPSPTTGTLPCTRRTTPRRPRS